MTELQVGTLLDSKFELLEEVGRGGMGIVYRAHQPSMGRDVAVKILRPNGSETGAGLKRFRMEARLISLLEHPHIVQIYAIGIVHSGQPYIAMEFLPGEHLFDRIERDGPLSWKEALPIFIQVCDALQYAHEKEIVHRDVKPSNIVLSQNENGTPMAKLVDFGVAKMMANDLQKLTRTNAVVGSVFYTSPEQFAGKPADARSDIYGLGCSLYEALTGKKACVGDTVYEIIEAHLKQDPQPVNQANPMASIPDDLQYIVDSMLRKDPEQRLQSVAEIRQKLEDISNGKRIAQRPLAAAPAEKTPPKGFCMPPDVVRIVLAAIVTLVLGYCVITYLPNSNQPVVTALTTDPAEIRYINWIKANKNPHSFEHAKNLFALANLYKGKKLFAQAIVLYERALPIVMQSKEDKEKKYSIDILSALGGSYAQTGQFSKSIPKLNQALSLTGPGKVPFGVNYQLLDVYQTIGEYETAEKYLRVIFPIIESGFASPEERRDALQRALVVDTAFGDIEKFDQHRKWLREIEPDAHEFGYDVPRVYRLIRDRDRHAIKETLRLLSESEVTIDQVRQTDAPLAMRRAFGLHKLLVECRNLSKSPMQSVEIAVRAREIEGKLKALTKELGDPSTHKLPF